MARDTLQEARAALRERQGSGARYDAAGAPAEPLAFARLATAYFARLLNTLADEALWQPCALAGWSRAHVVADAGYQARALTRLTEWATSGEPQRMYPSQEARRAEIAFGATLPARALRHLFRHASVHLDVEWRDLSSEAWKAQLSLPDGTPARADETPWMRSRHLWLAAVDLDAGGSFLDFPPKVVDRLIEEQAGRWTGEGLTLVPTDRADPIALAGGGASVRGRAADLARYVTGRGARRLDHAGTLPTIVAEPL